MRISIRHKRAEEVFGRLIRAYDEGLPPYRRTNGNDREKDIRRSMHLPHDERNMSDRMPVGGREHALFLFCVCFYMRGGIKSKTAVRALSKIYDLQPDLFLPETFVGASVLEVAPRIRKALKSVGLGFQSKQVSEFWVLNFQKLAHHWNGDPRNLFGERCTYRQLCKRIIRGKYGKKRQSDEKFLSERNGFYGFREKMTSMLAYYYIDSGLIPSFLHPVPVDLHVMRVLLTNEVLVPTELNGEGINARHVEEPARKVTLWYCKKHEVDPIVLCNVLWVLSERFCKRQLGNSSTTGGYKARSTVVEAKPIRWTPGTIQRYMEVCGSCSVQTTCRWNIPAQRYYRHGRLFFRGERPKPPQRLLFEGF